MFTRGAGAVCLLCIQSSPDEHLPSFTLCSIPFCLEYILKTCRSQNILGSEGIHCAVHNLHARA